MRPRRHTRIAPTRIGTTNPSPAGETLVSFASPARSPRSCGARRFQVRAVFERRAKLRFPLPVARRDHAVAYVDGKVHANGMENFWLLLKRGINGTYVSVEPFHLFRYLDEQVYRFNNRKLTDGERFSLAVSGIVGKRLTFDELTGKLNLGGCAG